MLPNDLYTYIQKVNNDAREGLDVDIEYIEEILDNLTPKEQYDFLEYLSGVEIPEDEIDGIYEILLIYMDWDKLDADNYLTLIENTANEEFRNLIDMSGVLDILLIKKYTEGDYRECTNEETPSLLNSVENNPTLIFYQKEKGDITYCYDYGDVEWLIANGTNPYTNTSLSDEFMEYLNLLIQQEDFQDFLEESREEERGIQTELGNLRTLALDIANQYPYIAVEDIVNASSQDILHFIQAVKVIDESGYYDNEHIQELKDITDDQKRLEMILEDVIEMNIVNEWANEVDEYLENKRNNNSEMIGWDDLFES